MAPRRDRFGQMQRGAVQRLVEGDGIGRDGDGLAGAFIQHGAVEGEILGVKGDLGGGLLHLQRDGVGAGEAMLGQIGADRQIVMERRDIGGQHLARLGKAGRREGKTGGTGQSGQQSLAMHAASMFIVSGRARLRFLR